MKFVQNMHKPIGTIHESPAANGNHRINGKIYHSLFIIYY